MDTQRPLGALAAAVFAITLLAAACTIDPVVDPSPSASAVPTSSGLASDSPTASPSSPSPEPLPTASATPNITPSPSASASASAPPSQDPPVGQILFRDTFDDTTSPLWGTGSQSSGSVTYADGTLRIALTQAPSSLWSWRAFEPEAALQVVRSEGLVTTSGTGAAGWLCGSEDDRFVGGLIHSSGDWVIVDITDSTSTALDRGPLPEGIDPALPHVLSVECSGTSAGPMRIRLWVDGLEVASVEQAAGIAAFDRAGAYAFTDTVAYAAAFDDAVVFGGEAGSAGSPVPPSPDPSP